MKKLLLILLFPLSLHAERMAMIDDQGQFMCYVQDPLTIKTANKLLPIEELRPPFDPKTQVLGQPVIQVLPDRVLEMFPVIDLSEKEQIEKEAKYKLRNIDHDVLVDLFILWVTGDDKDREQVKEKIFTLESK